MMEFSEKETWKGLRIAVVVPTIREDCIRAFLRAWNFDAGVNVLVIEDHAQPTFDLDAGENVLHLSHANIERDLGASAWIVPRQTDCVRSYGYWRAWQLSADMIVTLDDDCFPTTSAEDFLQMHWARLAGNGCESAWVNTLEGITPRGVPYHRRERQRPCVLNHGLWTNVPDFDAVTQLANVRTPCFYAPREFTIPRGSYFPMCGMNLAFRRDVIPALYFLLMGPQWGVDRFGDIWAGILVKKICDHLGYAVTSGAPFVEHQRASNVFANLRKEASGMELNEMLWQSVDAVRLHGDSFTECYREIADALAVPGEYGLHLRRAMRTWSELLEERT